MNINIGFNTNTNSYNASISTPDKFTYGSVLNENLCNRAEDKVYTRDEIVALVVEEAYPYSTHWGGYRGYAVDTAAGELLCINCARKELADKLADDTENLIEHLPEWQYDEGDLGIDGPVSCNNCYEVIAEGVFE